MLNENRLQLHHLRQRYSHQIIAKTASAIAIAIGCLVLLGWCFDVTLLKTGFVGGSTMKANTALCFILSGGALWLVGKGGRIQNTESRIQDSAKLRKAQQSSKFSLRISRGFAVTCATVAGLTLSQYLFGWNLGIDQLLFQDTSAEPTTLTPGHMGLNTALNFVLISSALILLGRKTEKSYKYAQLLTLVAGLISVQALIGHAYGVEVFYNTAPYTTAMALHTALTFTVLCIGVLWARADRGLMRLVTSTRPAGLLARRLLLAAIAVPLVLGWFIVQGEHAGYYDPAFAVSVFTLVVIVIFVVLIWQNADLNEHLNTERDRALGALRANEQKLLSFVDANIIGILFSDIYGNILQANDELLRIIGYTRAELLAGKVSWIDLTPAEYLYLDEQGIAEARARGACTPYEKEYIRKDGSRVSVLVGYVLLGEKREESVAFIVDLTENKQVLAALQQSEKRYRILAENVPQLIWISRSDGSVEYLNQRWFEYTGLQPHESLGWDSRQVVHPDDLPLTLAQWQTALATGCKIDVQYRLRRYDGVYRWHLGRGIPLLDEHGQIVQWFGTCTDIEDRYVIEQELRAANQRINNILESITDAFVAVDPQWRYTYVNSKAEQFLGKPQPELIGKNCWEVFPELLHSQAYIHAHQALAQQETITHEEFFPLFNKWFAISLYPSPGGLSIYFHDITRRKQAETALKVSEERYRQLIELSPEGIFIQYAGKFVFVNSSFVKLLGATDAAEIIGKSVIEFIHPEFKAAVVQRIHQLTVEKTPVPLMEQKWLRLDGSVFDAEVKSVPFTYQDQSASQAVISDISDRIAIQAALRESEQRFRFLAESIPQIVWTSRPDGWIDYYNQRWVDYTGMTLEETQGWGWSPVLHPEDLQMCIDRWTHAVATGEPYEIEYRFKRASDGQYRWHLGRAIPLRNQDGSISKWFGTCTDIEDQKQALAERDRLLASEQLARTQAETSNRMKDEFLAVVSHELRSPLNAILGWVQMLRTGRLNETMTAKALETIERNARSQTQLIEDILEVSRIITGKIRLNVRTCELVPIIESAIETVRLAADAKQIRLSSILDPAAGPISGDPERLQQVVWNLLSNAIKFTPKEGRVQIRLERINSHVEIVVSDSGIGIKPDFLPFVFDRFRQADSSTTRSYNGLGLGLSIVRHLVELHGGTVSVASAGEAQGTTFIVKLPCMAVIPVDASEPVRVHPTSGIGVAFDNPPMLTNVKVLVVDDEVDAREFVMTVLSECGATVKTVGSAAEALTAISQWKPDVLVSDIGMPETDGYALIRKVRWRSPPKASLSAADGGKIPAAALTAYARSEDRTRALKEGFQMHLPKPIEPAELATVVASLVGRV